MRVAPLPPYVPATRRILAPLLPKGGGGEGGVGHSIHTKKAAIEFNELVVN